MIIPVTKLIAPTWHHAALSCMVVLFCISPSHALSSSQWLMSGLDCWPLTFWKCLSVFFLLATFPAFHIGIVTIFCFKAIFLIQRELFILAARLVFRKKTINTKVFPFTGVLVSLTVTWTPPPNPIRTAWIHVDLIHFDELGSLFFVTHFWENAPVC